MFLKNKILEMPIWKASLIVVIIMITFGVFLEELFVHSIFRMFDKTLTRMEREAKEDTDDLNDENSLAQREYCDDYKILLREKKALAERNPNEFSYDFDENVMEGHENKINIAIHYHTFNRALCERSLKKVPT